MARHDLIKKQFLKRAVKHLLSIVVKAVILQKKGSINGLSQQRIDCNHDEKHCQLQDRVETKKDCTSHHCQYTSEDKILNRRQQWLFLVSSDYILPP